MRGRHLSALTRLAAAAGSGANEKKSLTGEEVLRVAFKGRPETEAESEQRGSTAPKQIPEARLAWEVRKKGIRGQHVSQMPQPELLSVEGEGKAKSHVSVVFSQRQRRKCFRSSNSEIVRPKTLLTCYSLQMKVK